MGSICLFGWFVEVVLYLLRNSLSSALRLSVCLCRLLSKSLHSFLSVAWCCGVLVMLFRRILRRSLCCWQLRISFCSRVVLGSGAGASWLSKMVALFCLCVVMCVVPCPSWWGSGGLAANFVKVEVKAVAKHVFQQL